MLINFRTNGWDAMVIAMANKGASARTIARETGLTVNQVTGRLHKNGTHISDYRLGIGPTYHAILAETRRRLRATYSTLKAPR